MFKLVLCRSTQVYDVTYITAVHEQQQFYSTSPLLLRYGRLILHSSHRVEDTAHFHWTVLLLCSKVIITIKTTVSLCTHLSLETLSYSDISIGYDTNVIIVLAVRIHKDILKHFEFVHLFIILYIVFLFLNLQR